MAEDLNNIFQDFENKSVEELGSSLLGRQAEINKKQAKEAKKAKRIGQTLALIGVGQKIFKNSYNKRMKELDKHEMFLLSNNDSQAKEVAQLGRIMQYMPDADWSEKNKALDIDSKVKLYLEEHDGTGLSVKFKPVIDSLIKQDVGEKQFNAFKANTDTYETAYNSALHEVLKDYLDTNSDTGKANYLTFENELRDVLQTGDMDRLDLFRRARSISAYDLTQAEKRIIAERKLNYRNRGVFNTIKDGLSQVGLRNQANGGINLFKSINETDLAGGNLNDVLNNLDLGGLIIGAVDKSMGEYRNTFESITDLAIGDEKLLERAEANLQDFNKNIKIQNVYDSDNKYRMTIDRKKWNNFADDILADGNEAMKNEWLTDIAGISLAFKNDIDFAERVYIGGLENRGMSYTEKDIQEFRKKISSSEKYRLDIATAMTAQQGFRAGGTKLRGPYEADFIPWNAAEYYDRNTDEQLYERYGYNRYDGNISAVLGEGIKFNQQTNSYVTDKNWNSMNTETKQQSFDLRFRQIARGKINPREKIMMFEKLFSDIPNPYNLTYEEYLEEKADFELKRQIRTIND
jgi:hypothetical protein|tara:strand:- start:812 stop:2536 length:1725 start_codon:yes stop_codon:yes gene_type:complete